jgi:hypothetical protein
MRLLVLVLAGLLLCATAAAAGVITGTDGDDRLVGTPGADTLVGRGGRDVISGGPGADLVLAGPGRDAVDAGPGNDLVSIEYDGARDRATCGAGTDTVTADPLDRVAEDCELVARRLSRDPYSDPGSQHETQAEPSSFTFGSTTVAVFQVGRRFDGGATNIGYAVSRDDGRTWTKGLLPGLTVTSRPPGPNARASDPVVAYDATHQVWLASTLAIDGRTTRLTVNRSADGMTWEDALAAAEEVARQDIAFDKNWIACDNGAGSPFRGRCYLAYTHSSDDDMLALRWTTDGGLTWSAETDIGASPAVGVNPVVRPTGELVLTYLWETRPLAVAASHSTDGGVTFGAPVRIADVSSSACGIRRLRGFTLPSADVDAAGRIWVAWHDCPAPRSPSAVFVASSRDGVTWSRPAAVTSGTDAVLPAIGVDAGTGRVAIAYHRSREGGVDVELVESRPNVAGWGSPRRLSARTMRLEWMPDTTLGRMLGDYISVRYSGGRPLAVWVLASEPVAGRFRQAVYATRG